MEQDVTIRWIKLESWHIVTASGTRCGLEVDPEEVHGYSEDLPLGEKSCETCLRLRAHDDEHRK